MRRPERVQVVGMQAPVAHRLAAALVAVVDQHAEALAEHRQRHAQLHAIAAGVQLPRAADARLERREALAVFAVLDAACRDRARAGRADEHLLLAPLRVGEAEPDAIAHGTCIERARARGVEHRVRIAHLDHEVKHALKHAGEHAEAMLRILLVPGPGGRIVRPVLGITVDERRRGERHGPQVIEAGLEQRIDRAASAPAGARYRRSTLPSSEAASVSATDWSDVCSPSRSADSISRA